MGMTSIAMTASAVFMELGVSIQQGVRLSHDILKVCVKDDVRDTFKQASDNMKSVKYIGGRLMANGADILDELSDSVSAFEEGRYEEFGSHMGEAMRKTVLSNNTNMTLPEGRPGEMVLANMSAGFIDGFFGEGFALDMSLATADPVHIDLHECMANNVVFFQSVWSSTMFWFAQKTQEHKDALRKANATHADEKTADELLKEQHHKDTAQFGTAMALTMMQVPAALRRCNITKQQEEALVDAFKSLGSGMKMHLTMPADELNGKKVAADNLAKAMKDWEKMRWYKFGVDLGLVLQEVVTVMFPSKYSVDASGALRSLLQASGAGRLGSVERSQLLPVASLLTVAMLATLAWRGLGRRRLACAPGAARLRDPEALLPQESSCE
jgi:hypothetical protein